MRQRVLTYGHAELRRRAKPVAVVNDDIRRLAGEMLSAMYAEAGVGLAAEQIGRSEAICVIDITPALPSPNEGRPPEVTPVPMPLVFVNPEITGRTGTQTGQEGCLSFPGVFVNIKRAANVTVKYTNMDNQVETLQADGFLARAIQHEIDHLKGILLVDRMSPVQKVAMAGKLRKIKEET